MHLFSRHGMVQIERVRVERLARDGEMIFFVAVERVIHDRVLDVRHVDANLVRAPRFQAAIEPGIMWELLQDAEMCHGRFPRLRLHRPFHSVLWASSERQSDDAGIGGQVSVDERQIMTDGLVRADFLSERLIGPRRFGGDHDARRILVEPMHDTRARRVADIQNRRPHMVQKRLHERPRHISRRRMAHHAPRLVEDDHLLVFVENRERDILRCQHEGFRLFIRQRHDVPFRDAQISLRRLSRRERDRALLQKTLHAPARKSGNVRQKDVETHPGRYRRHCKLLFRHASFLQK